jgi:hypothetical protein
MRKIAARSYEGRADETVTVWATASGNAAVRFRLDGREIESPSPLKFRITEARYMTVALAGEPGAKCRVTIEPVGESSDFDLFTATKHDPFPVQHYGFRIV